MRSTIRECGARFASSVIIAFLLVLGVLFWAAPSAEAKGKGKGKSSAREGSVTEHAGSRSKEAKEKAEKKHKEHGDEAEEAKEKAEKAKEKSGKGKEKSPEDMKEVDKGSEKGQAMREQHRRKWWKLWGK